MKRGRRMILGVTGEIAAGKSTVARIFAARGAAVVSADDLAREAVSPGSETLKRLTAHFGNKILRVDGSLDRRALADIVFHNEKERVFLNAVTHAAIAELAVRRLEELEAQGASLIVYESPLLFEAGAEDRVDWVLVVIAPQGEQMKRLLRRPGMTKERAAAIIASQMSQEEKAARGDFVIETNGTLEELEEKVGTLMGRLKALEGSSGRKRGLNRLGNQA